jgi:hypothetical protein
MGRENSPDEFFYGPEPKPDPLTEEEIAALEIEHRRDQEISWRAEELLRERKRPVGRPPVGAASHMLFLVKEAVIIDGVDPAIAKARVAKEFKVSKRYIQRITQGYSKAREPSSVPDEARANLMDLI